MKQRPSTPEDQTHAEYDRQLTKLVIVDSRVPLWRRILRSLGLMK
jgi:hypothetical protein